MTSIGDTLRRERIRRGLQLQQVASETKIGLHLLQAMEADQFDRLPGGVFTRSFLRQYAHTLGLDEEELIASLKEQFEAPPEPTPAPPPKQRFPNLPPMPRFEDVRDRLRSDSSLGALVWVVIVALVCAGVYQLLQGTRITPDSQSAVSSAKRTTPRTSANLKPVVPTAPIVTAPKPEFRPAVVSDNGTITIPPSSRQPAPAEADDTARQPAPAEAGDTSGAVRVAFTSSEPVWVSIKSDGARAYSGTIEGQQTKQFDAARKMVVLVGNAGALKTSLNGRPVGPFGSPGEIRLVMFTPEGAHVIQRAPSTPPTPGDSTAAPAAERP
jgi:cytoskeleton protein RodZ